MTQTTREKLKILRKENKELSKNNRITLKQKTIEQMENWLERKKDSKLLLDPKNLSRYLGIQEYAIRSRRAVLTSEKVSNGASVRPKDKELPLFRNERLVFPN